MNLKPGNLLEWFDYRNNKRYVGLYLRKRTNRDSFRVTLADIIVLCNGKESEWVSWKCRVIDEG